MDAETHLRCRTLNTVIATACIAFSAGTPVTATADPLAAPAPGILESRVSLSDLDLSTPDGVRAAHKRLQKKAEHLCRELVDSASATYRWRYAACAQATLANALQQLNVPALVRIDNPRAVP